MSKTLGQKLLAFQGEVAAITKDSDNPFFNSKYFDVNKVLEIVKPILTKHGIVLMQHLDTRYSSEGNFATSVLRTALHNAEAFDEVIQSEVPLTLPADPQKAGSVCTYYRRYALVTMLALQGEIDDDGNAASGKAAPAAKTKVPGKKVEAPKAPAGGLQW